MQAEGYDVSFHASYQRVEVRSRDGGRTLSGLLTHQELWRYLDRYIVDCIRFKERQDGMRAIYTEKAAERP